MPLPLAPPLREASDDAAAAKAARDALARVLRERVALVQDLDGEIGRLLEAALARITAQLAAAPSDYQQWVLPRLADAVQRVLEELADQAGARTSDALSRAWRMGGDLVDGPIQAAPALTPPTAAAVAVAPDLRQLRAMQHFSTQMIRGATADAVNAINRALGQVVLGVSTPFDAMRIVAKLLPDRTRSQIRGIVNSNLATAFNAAAFERLRAQAARDPGLKKQWRRSGKRHSRVNHDAADGQVQDIEQPFVIGSADGKGTVSLMFPADPQAPIRETINCGCVALPWKSTWRMRSAGPKQPTAAELADKAAAKKPVAVKKGKAVSTTQQRILDAFAASGGTWRDVTGQQLVVNAKLFPAGVADDRLKARGQDLASYWAVQTLKKPTEVWQTEMVDGASGELVRGRRFLKRFESGGQTWLARADFTLEAGRWVPAGPYAAEREGAGIGAAMTAARAGVRVWPRAAG